MREAWVYMLANRYRGTIYTGVTANIAVRAAQHRARAGSKFASKYRLLRLVHVERHDTMPLAIAREKAAKKWLRDWKIELIESTNPDWNDLFPTINA
ncbi:MAG: GIY-YIG nuclease family protein [Sphingomonadaceae bacterium]|nr:GIY-YIG nuclease family protein [Sphingomonadaceae bacterium]